MDRVLIIGCSAAGKSTVARELGKTLRIEVIHLDKLLWKPGCNLTRETEEPQVVRELLGRPRWIMDGNYTASLPMRLAAADTVVFIDYPRPLCLMRAIKRLLTFAGRTRPDMGAACPERLDWNFFRWIWRYPRDERPQLLRHLEMHGSRARIVTLTSPKETDRWLEQVRQEARSLHDEYQSPAEHPASGSNQRSQVNDADRSDRRSLAPAARH